MTEEKLEKAHNLKGAIDRYQGIIDMLNDQDEKQNKIILRVLDGNRSTFNDLRDLLDDSVIDDIEIKIRHNLVDKRDKFVKQFNEL